MTVGERIKEVREKTGMSQVDFADKINVSKQTLYKYENNLITNIPSDKIEAVAKVGGVSPAYLMGWTAEDVADAIADLADTALKTAMTPGENQRIRENSYENLVIKEMGKMNQKGKVKLLDTAREMVCNPLYNPNYEVEVNAAHTRTDIDVPEGTDTSDNDIMDDEDF